MSARQGSSGKGAPAGAPQIVGQWLTWAKSLPSQAPDSICLPAYGGRVIARTYDTHKCTYDAVPGSDRWVIETADLPIASTSTNGLGGVVYPGDCIIYIGTSSEDPMPVVWFPQRVLDVVVTGSRQTVVTLGDLTVRQEGIEPAEFAPVLHAPLTGTIRRWALEPFGLNVDCERCGARGNRIMYGLPAGPPGPHDVIGGCIVDAANPDYTCRSCGAAWRITDDGHIEFTNPGQPSLTEGL